MLQHLRRMFDRAAEHRAELLVDADRDAIRKYRVRVARNVDARRIRQLLAQEKKR